MKRKVTNSKTQVRARRRFKVARHKEIIKRKGKNGILQVVFGRSMLIVLLLALQIVFMVFMFFRWQFSVYAYGGTYIVTLVFVNFLINHDMGESSRQSWLAVTAVMPVVGLLLFVWIDNDIGHHIVRDRILSIQKETQPLLHENTFLRERLEKEEPRLAQLETYTMRAGGYPAYKNTSVRYCAWGTEKMKALLEALEEAEQFIFMEYFIIEEGVFWNSILEVLQRKVAQGVEVRVMYDGTNAIYRVPYSYAKTLESMGIRCKVVSPMRPTISTHYNNRDHRKIVVIDGQVAFTGGINLADEYVGLKKPYGDWKDTAICLRGEAVRTFTLMFLQMWHVMENNTEFEPYLKMTQPVAAQGYVLPYGDNPFNSERISETVYLDIINRAMSYVHIMTPYLIIDDTILDALIYAAKRGVRVRIILPHKPDKKSAFALAYTHYRKLIEAGVEIYEYTPGFMHAKQFVSDDEVAVVGTVNLDYRSLRLHFECAALLWKVPQVAQIEADFENTRRKCEQITKEKRKKLPRYRKVLGALLKIFSPLM